SCVEQFDQIVQMRTLRTHFLSIWDDPETHTLTLVSRKRQALTISFDRASSTVRLTRPTPPHLHRTPARVLPFEPCPGPEAVGYRLGGGTGPDGSKAFLDSRGLLHLQSADANVPEVSIVLQDGHLAGWCADGTLWGDAYFTGFKEIADRTARVYESAIEAFV